MNELPPPPDAALSNDIKFDGSLPRDREYVACQLPYGSPTFFTPIVPDPYDIENQRRGLIKRLARDLPIADDDLVRGLSDYTDRYLAKHCVPLETILEFEEWLAQTSYSESRKAQLREAEEKLNGAKPPGWKTSIIHSFIKRESYAGAKCVFKEARWINSRCDAFKVYSGRFFKSIENEIYHVNDTSRNHFIKHVPVPERPKLIESLKAAGAKYYATDYSSFEAHFVPKMMEACELRLYRHMLKKFPIDAERICAVICADRAHGPEVHLNKIRTRAGVKLDLEGRRMSGDMCTSLGNGFTNLMLWGYMCELGNARWDGFIEGDDGIFAVYEGDAPTAALARRLGWTIAIEEHEDPSTASFCGCICAEGQVIRDPTSVLTSLGWTLTQPLAGRSLRKKLCRAKMLSLAYELPQCPVLGAIARRGIVLTEGTDPRFELDGYKTRPKIGEIPDFAPTMALRLLFEKLYGVDPEVQVQLETAIMSGVADNLECVAKYLPAPAACVTMDLLYRERVI